MIRNGGKDARTDSDDLGRERFDESLDDFFVVLYVLKYELTDVVIS